MTRKGYAPDQIAQLGTDADNPHRWKGGGWSYEGYRLPGKDGEWRIHATQIDGTHVLDMRVAGTFAADEVADIIADQIGWAENGAPSDDHTDHAAVAAERERQERAAIRKEILRP